MIKMSLLLTLGFGSVFGLANLALWSHITTHLTAVLP